MQGIAIRGHTDGESNLNRLLLLRAHDAPELKIWLNRTQYKWISHDVVNEMLEIMAHAVVRSLLGEVRKANFYAIMIDETSDIAVKEQVSFCIRFAEKLFQIHELFFGFYATASTDGETLYKIVKDILLRFDLPITACRGQRYDGAANMSGKFSGVKTRIIADEQRAVYVHCVAHSLNLVVQESMQHIPAVRNFINTCKDIINTVKDSPKRLALFETIQDDTMENNTALQPFCPTRWCMRASSLRSVKSNYAALKDFFHQLADSEMNDVGAKAEGLYAMFAKSDTYILLSILVSILDPLETVNAALQIPTLNFSDADKIITTLKELYAYRRRAGFDDVWRDICTEASALDLQEPALPRQRKIPKRLDGGSQQHQYGSPDEHYRQLYYEMIDGVIMTLNEHLEVETLNRLKQIEKFVLGCPDVPVQVITNFYCDDFDGPRLLLHRDMLLDVARPRNCELQSLGAVMEFLGTEDNVTSIAPMLPELVKLIQLKECGETALKKNVC
jgi:hypothetical protein